MSGSADVEFQVQPADAGHATLLLAMADASGTRQATAPGGGGTDFEPDNDGALLVAYVNGQPAGCGGYRIFPGDSTGDTAEIARMYVRPGSRRTGLARSILAELERWAKADGYRRVVVRVAADQSAAQALVEITGYRPSEIAVDQLGHIYGKQLLHAPDSAGPERPR